MGFGELTIALGFAAACSGTFALDALVRDRVQRRRALRALRVGGRAAGAKRLRARLAALGRGAVPAGAAERQQARARLAAAGFSAPDALALCYGVRVAAAVGLGVAALAAALAAGGGRGALAAAFGSACAGYWGVDALLAAAGARRAARIFRELPDVLDLVLIGMEAGLGFDAAVERAAADLAGLAPVLSGELSRYGLELGSGVDREHALHELAERSGAPALRSVVNVLIQSSRYGTDVSQPLRESARSLRLERRQRAQERAARTPVRITFPLVFFILPALLCVVAGPALIQLFERLAR